MRTSRELARVIFTVIALATLSVAALAADPGLVYPPTSEASDQKPGSLLIYNYYSSDSANPNAKNTKINITNTSTSSASIVHFFFVSSACSVADFKTDLTPSQTYSFLVSDFDPDVSGYVMAVAEDSNGLPVVHNFLIGDCYSKDTEKAANLGAIAFAALWGDTSSVIPGGLASSPTVGINFNGAYGGYNKLPATVSLANIPSRAAGDRMTLILNQVGGNYLASTGNAGGQSFFGLLYDDAEQSQSFSVSVGCQSVNVLSDSYPRTVPRFSAVIPAGRTGWLKLYSQDGSKGILGAAIVWNIVSGTNFVGGHNLHHLTLTTGGTAATLPVFPY